MTDLDDATIRLVRAVDGLADDEFAAPSLLPRWSRAHVVAHLALNAEAMTGVLDGAARGEDVPMYSSNTARDHDIEELASAPVAELRERLLAAVGRYADALAAADVLTGTFARTPSAPTRVPVQEVPAMRQREVEIHHADLGIGYTAADWPIGFATALVDVAVLDQAAARPSFVVTAVDLDRSWPVGEPGDDAPVVRGPAGALAWWLTGRAPDPSVACDTGALPALVPWRAPVPDPEEHS